jgi:acyl carrier protein
MKDHLARELRLPVVSIDSAVPLETFPLDSLSVIALQTEISEWLGVDVPVEAFIEQPTLDALADFLAKPRNSAPPMASLSARSSTLAQPLRPAIPFFCLGGTMGKTGYQRPLAKALGAPYVYYMASSSPDMMGLKMRSPKSKRSLPVASTVYDRYSRAALACDGHNQAWTGDIT